MAIYHLHVKIHSRSGGGASAVGRAAYRAGERLVDEREQHTHDYRRRSAIDSAEIRAPDDAPAWARDRSRLWNAVEVAERRRDAQVAREVEIALPRELNRQARRDLVRQYVDYQFVARGMVADVALHDPDGRNPHAHVLLTTREIGPDGFGKKVRAWNDRALLKTWREQWEAHANHALDRAGYDERIDHRTLEAQREEATEHASNPETPERYRDWYIEQAAALARDPQLRKGRAERAQQRARAADPNAPEHPRIRRYWQVQTENIKRRLTRLDIQRELKAVTAELRGLTIRFESKVRNLGRDFGLSR